MNDLKLRKHLDVETLNWWIYMRERSLGGVSMREGTWNEIEG
jgi:hypothetical protein